MLSVSHYTDYVTLFWKLIKVQEEDTGQVQTLVSHSFLRNNLGSINTNQKLAKFEYLKGVIIE